MSDRDIEAIEQMIAEKRRAMPDEPELEPMRVAVPPAPRMTDEEFEAKRQRDQEEIAYRARYDAWRRFLAGRGSRYAECRLGNFRCESEEQHKAIATLREFVGNIREEVKAGTNVVLFGPKGTGKDHLLAALVRNAIRFDVFPQWINGMDLFGDIRDRMDSGLSEREYVQSLIRPDVLYISDPLPPSGTLTEFQQAIVFRVLDGRYSRRRPVWVSVNVAGGGELEQRMGAQNADRLRDGALAIYCNWPSYRKVRG